MPARVLNPSGAVWSKQRDYRLPRIVPTVPTRTITPTYAVMGITNMFVSLVAGFIIPQPFALSNGFYSWGRSRMSRSTFASGHGRPGLRPSPMGGLRFVPTSLEEGDDGVGEDVKPRGRLATR